MSIIIRSLISKTIGWLVPLAIRISMKKLTPKETNEESGTIGSAVVTMAVLSNCYLNMDKVLLTSVLPIVLGIMESHETRSLVENILVDANIPQILGRTLLGFAAEIEDAVLNVIISTYLEPEALNDGLLRWTGVNFNLQNLNLANSFAGISSYLQQIIRHHAPVVVGDLREVVVEPLFHGLVTYVQDLANALLSVGAKELPKRVLSRPSIVHAELENYYLGSDRVMDAEGQRYAYEAFQVAFSDQVLRSLNPPSVPRGLVGWSPIQKIILNTFLAPFEGVSTISELRMWEPEWMLETKDYRTYFYRPLQTATYGFIAHLQLTVRIRGNKITLKFFVESMTSADPNARKILKKVFGRKPLRFAYAASDDGGGATIRVSTPVGQLIATLTTRQKPPMTQSFSQVDIVHTVNAALMNFSSENTQVIQGALDNLNSVFKGIDKVDQLEKCAGAFKANSLFPLLLDYEYYTQPSWFATDFHLVFASPSRISGPARLTVIPKGSRAYRTFAFDHYACQELVAKIPAELHAPCNSSASRLRRAISRAATWLTGTVYGKNTSCFRKVQYSRDTGTFSPLILRRALGRYIRLQL